MASLLVSRFGSGTRALPMLILFGLILVALVLMSKATENSARFGELYSWLLLLSTIGLLALALLIGYNLYRLLQNYRRRAPGSRLTARLVMMSVVIAAVPLIVVYFFSQQFIRRGIDSWFDVRVEQALRDALDLSQAALDLRMREVLKQTQRMADAFADSDDGQAALRLGETLNDSDATELTLFGQSGRIVATAGIDTSVIVPSRPPEAILMHVRQGHEYVSLDPISDSGFYIRAVVGVARRDADQEPVILQALFPVPERLGPLAESVQSAFDSYRGLTFLRAPLKTSFVLMLSLVLLFGILAAFWSALFAARGLVAPIRELAEGTRAVAAGQYDQQLPSSSNDELGFLVHSFNQMTRNLAQARDAAQHSQKLQEQQRAYLEAVLARLSSGVLALDHNGRLRTANAAAGHILGVNLQTLLGKPPSAGGYSHVDQLFSEIAPHLAKHDEWREEIVLFSGSGRQVLMCRGSTLPDPVGSAGGHVIVFDDITTLVQAQRDAAWGEVARRLAHEIKNPLTPIQLATERIRHKVLGAVGETEARIIDRGTDTIIREVQALKDMVAAFNEYARPPVLQLTTVALNDFITEVLYLYKDYPAGIEVKLDLDPSQPRIEADKGRLRQLLHNLVKNALEAMSDGHGSTLWIRTTRHIDASSDYVELECRDDGPGFPERILAHVFEPYVTTKPKGTGLGLAIVKKIVEEHGGVIHLENLSGGGAHVSIRFPIMSARGAPLPGKADHTLPQTVEPK